ncbi:MAG: sigma-70 family RNA polymerase sigma factor [Acidobacteria bacterium]|nr:sigma-70 family RNA polymerase sigma factor [Acidobacteriota bacterium]
MHELAAGYPGRVVSLEAEPASEVAREFEQRLADCSTLAFRVALGVLRNCEDAEDMAQEAFLRAYRNYHRLREPERFRAWLARIARRMARRAARPGRRSSTRSPRDP